MKSAMPVTRAALALAALLIVGVADLALAQRTKSVSNSRGGSRTSATTAKDGAIVTDRSATGAGGQTATAQSTTTANGDGTVTNTRGAEGPNGNTTSGTATYTSNGDGTVSRDGSYTGAGGQTRTATSTASRNGSSTTATRRTGTTVNRSKTRSR